MFKLFKRKIINEEKINYTLKEYKKGLNRHYIEFTHNDTKYIIFYTKYGTEGTSIYIADSEKYIGRTSDINPTSNDDIIKYNIKSQSDFIERFIIPIINKYDHAEKIKSLFISDH